MDDNDLEALISSLRLGRTPTESQVRFLCAKGAEVLGSLPNVVSLSPPITVCGDTHGQLYDLFELFSIGGECPDTNYLFLGDYVDRGYYSLETFLLLLSLQIRYPHRMTLLRGNHESRQTTQAYGFYEEVVRKFGSADLWTLICSVFDLLPLCATIGGRIFCVHGGLSPSLARVDQIQRLDRKREVPERGQICDLLWSDPDNVPDFVVSPRGAGYLFGESAVRQFNRNNGFDLILRAHQLADDGYVEWFDGKLFTVWSAPNYCYRGGNPASLLEVSPSLATRWKVFDAAPADARGPMPNKTKVEYFM